MFSDIDSNTHLLKKFCHTKCKKRWRGNNYIQNHIQIRASYMLRTKGNM